MPVRCRGRVLRIVRPALPANIKPSADTAKTGVAVRLETYEYLAAGADTTAAFARISPLHSDHNTDRNPLSSSARPLLD
jgi:hypothetical protein